MTGPGRAGEIDGITRDDTRRPLPVQPASVVSVLRAALASPPPTREVLIARAEAFVGDGYVPERALGVADWLGTTGVAAWSAEGTLALHPCTSLYDLAVRMGAWAAAQDVPEEQRDAAKRWVREVASLAMRRPASTTPVGQRAEVPWPPRVAPARPVPPVTRKIERLLAALDLSFRERKRHVRAVLLALLAGEHVLMLGPPGTAKSLLARSVRGVFRDAVWFEYLLSRFTHPDELFGPVSIPGLKQEDYRRLTQGFLPQAQVAFLDEVFKANSAILNSLLTLINERVFHHGQHVDAAPLIGLVGASNELPDPDGGLGALLDRFVVRVTVPPLADAQSFLAVATGELAPLDLQPADQLTVEDLASIRSHAEAVHVPDPVRGALVQIWQAAREADWQVSDRRWRSSVKVLRVAAAAEGRQALEPKDLLLLDLMLPPTPDRAAEVREVVLMAVNRLAAPTAALRTQWQLLRFERVCPPQPTMSWQTVPAASVDVLRARRGLHATWMGQHIQAAARALSDARGRREAAAESLRVPSLWNAALPARLLAGNLHAARELSAALQLVEAYKATLEDEAASTAALVESLGDAPAKELGLVGAAFRLRIPDAGVDVGVTERGQRLPLREARAGWAAASSEVEDDETEAFETPTVVLQLGDLEAMLRNEQPRSSLVEDLPEWAKAAASRGLEAMCQRLGRTGLPRPPAWPVLPS